MIIRKFLIFGNLSQDDFHKKSVNSKQMVLKGKVK